MKDIQLYDYQIEGIEFLKTHPNAILADDVGMGKTAQALLSLTEEDKNVVIFAPKTLIHHWIAEINKWLDGKYKVFTDIDSYYKYEGYKILLSTYQAGKKLVAYIKEHKHFNHINKFICDEAHKIKNPFCHLSNRIEVFMGYNNHSKKLFITATPIVNRRQDLLSLILYFDGSIRQYWTFNSNNYTFDIPDDKFKEYVKKYVLRREKRDYLDLPRVYLKTIFLEKDHWIDLYLKMLKRDNNIGDSGWNMVQKAKQVCITPYTINNSKFVLPTETTKIQEVVKLINESKTQNKQVVVFSEYKRVLDYLGKLLKEDYQILNGKTPFKKRKMIINDFREGKFNILLLTIGVGGEGLNLSNASVVIFLDLWWHWASFLQALNRTHRIGQKNEVWVYHYLYENTIEEKIRDIIRKKRSIML